MHRLLSVLVFLRVFIGQGIVLIGEQFFVFAARLLVLFHGFHLNHLTRYYTNSVSIKRTEYTRDANLFISAINMVLF